MKHPLPLALSLAAITALAGAVFAAPAQAEQPLFEAYRDLESRSHQERIRILQEADACIRAAADREALRACEAKEREARQALRAEVEPKRQALRAEFKALRQTRCGGGAGPARAN
jgi:hypothetical protein